MPVDILTPRLDLLSEQYLLVQAWKKTVSYIRYHNWYADTLELDQAAVNLPAFLNTISDQLRGDTPWTSDPLRIVPAPKSQKWSVSADTKSWAPKEGQKIATKLRPLAHVSLRDQVAATAVMLCLADRVETIQGDPRQSITESENRRRVISYGNRLFCDPIGQALQHRWGSGKLYRAYYQDYRTFLSRPEISAEAASKIGQRAILVHSDFRQFYDRVRPNLLSKKLLTLAQPNDDPRFFALAQSVFNWGWNRKDLRDVSDYATRSGIEGFSAIALPQGLVASGFMANLVLLDFDQALRSSFGTEIAPGLKLADASRYVDDLRLVFTDEQGRKPTDVEGIVSSWLARLLDKDAEGVAISADKTFASVFGGDERPLVRQSRKMARIQTAVSGGFDAAGGEEVLDAVQGLIRAQQRYAEQRIDAHGWSFSPIPDVRDATVARFAAGRFRSTYRSLRPLLEDREAIPTKDEHKHPDAFDRPRPARSRDELDDEARAFALGLIETWVEDPSNVRLLRIGLDLWPAADLITNVLDLLRPFTKKGGGRMAPRRVAWYCLAEIFRAAATETGFVEDSESLPARVDLAAYRNVLKMEAVRLAALPSATLPWYLKQQVLLFLAANDPGVAPVVRTGRSPETKHYRELIRFLRGEGDGMTGADFATLAILTRRSFLGENAGLQLALIGLNARRLEQVADRDPSFALEILSARPDLRKEVSPRLRDDFCLETSAKSDGLITLSDAVLKHDHKPLRNEQALLQFAEKFLSEWSVSKEFEAITPTDVALQLSEGPSTLLTGLRISSSRVAPIGSIYKPPQWCPSHERWRFQLGYLLRFILSGRPDFTKPVRPTHWKEGTATYRPPDGHWQQRMYGLYNGQDAFGDNWLPISDWMERLLSALVEWPGCKSSELVETVRKGREATLAAIRTQLEETNRLQGPASSVLMLRLKAPRAVAANTLRPLRACVVQTVVPRPDDIVPRPKKIDTSDLTCSNPVVRQLHRNHLSAALAAVEKMLELRETHRQRDGRLDWLILPELAVHPRDVKTHLIPFARAHKTIILAGLTYEEIVRGQPLVNSALWIIPTRSMGQGLQIITRRQGKQFLAPMEQAINSGAEKIRGFRPCQWLVGYEWSNQIHDEPLWLTASICYDATDLRLAADLRNRSDVFAIPALNKDVGTFDQMALALHYHMFQMVIVANNGEFGGSNAYVPYKDTYTRQVFHLHGQPQASIAFLEIDNVADYLERKRDALSGAPSAKPSRPQPKWKSLPAGILPDTK